MPIRMLVTDLERTLLRTDKTISEYTASILNRCKEHGIKVVFATARPKRTIPYLSSVDADAVIVHNGAVTYVNDKLFHHFGIDSAVKNQVLKAISNDYPNTNLSVEIDEVLYANFDVSVYWGNTQATRTDFTNLPDKTADKIIIGISSPDEVQWFAKYLTDDLYIEMNEGILALIMHKNATKLSAVQSVATHFNIDISEIAAFGDDYNDIGMLRECGLGIAVANALDDAKAAADDVCDSNDNDGVARWIEENLL
jgi:Cof subfamily protein (haloacid dehalogenase superfamily)